MIQKVEPIIREAGKILLSYYGKLSTTDISDKEAYDFVTIADKASENAIIHSLIKEFPTYGILAEESGFQGAKNTPYWVIDPLDGTKNFIQKIPYFAISIALVENNKSVFGAVYNPITDELFHSRQGMGAFLGNKKIKVSEKVNIKEGFLSTGFPFKKRELSTQYFNSFSDIFNTVTNIRRCGAAALDLAYLSAGRYDGFWEIGLSPWDIAAGAALIEEAGGVMTDFNNENEYMNNGYVIAGNNVFHNHLKSLVQKNFNIEDKHD